MTLTNQPYASVIMVDLPQDITLANADEVKHALRELLANGFQHILLNMKPCEFIDSSGLAVLVAIYKHLQPQGKIALLSPTIHVRALLELTRLHEILDIYEDQQNALSDLQNPAVEA